MITAVCSAEGKVTWVEFCPVSALTPCACSWQLWSVLEVFLQLRRISGKNKLTVVVCGAAWNNVFFRDRLWLTLQICLTIFYSKCSCCLSSEQEELVWLLSFKWWILSRGKKKKKSKPPANSHRYGMKRGKTNWIYLRCFCFFPLWNNPVQDIKEKRLCSEEQELTVLSLWLLFFPSGDFSCFADRTMPPPRDGRTRKAVGPPVSYSLVPLCFFYCPSPYAASYSSISGFPSDCWVLWSHHSAAHRRGELFLHILQCNLDLWGLPESGQEADWVSKGPEACFKSSEHHSGGETGLTWDVLTLFVHIGP